MYPVYDFMIIIIIINVFYRPTLFIEMLTLLIAYNMLQHDKYDRLFAILTSVIDFSML